MVLPIGGAGGVGPEFILDDSRAARGFARSLPRKVKESRFVVDRRTREPHNWTPTHVVLARFRGQTVAMADALFSEVGSAANAALVSLPGYGALALRCLVRLQQTFHADHWEASLRSPTAATVAIGRRYFDAVHDQTAWQMGQETAARFGLHAGFNPTPLFMTARTLRKYGLKSIADIDPETRGKIFELARLPTGDTLISPTGEELHYSDAVSLSFDLLDAPMSARQDAVRFAAAMLMARAAGAMPEPTEVERVLNIRRAADLMFQIDRAAAAFSHAT